MKKIMFTLSLMIMSVLSYGQLEKVKPVEKVLIGSSFKDPFGVCPPNVSLSYVKSDNPSSDTLYVIDYKDEQYKSGTCHDWFERVYFTGNSKLLNDLYFELKGDFDLEKDKHDIFNLNNNLDKVQFIVINTRVMFTKMLFISIGTKEKPTGYFYLSKKDLDKLFDKNQD